MIAWALPVPAGEEAGEGRVGMAGFLAAVTQAPMTAFIIVMEMVDGYNLVLSLMACSMVASAISRLVSRPLYASLTELQLSHLSEPTAGRRGDR